MIDSSPSVSAVSARPLRVALLGLGTVGRAVAAQLVDEGWRARVESAGTPAPRLVAVGVRDPDRPRGVDLTAAVERTDRLDELVGREDIDVVVELMGGTGDAGRLVERALAGRRAVVTANKKLVAERGPALEKAARASGAALRFEAAVGGGIPILGPIVRDLAANHITDLRGIVNGTTNFILSAMASEGRDYADVLTEAQRSGYAEADPTADVEGGDATDKLAILIRLAFGGWPDVAAIPRAAPVVGGDGALGITGVTRDDMAAASATGLVLKLVARAQQEHHGIVAATTVVAVPADSPLGRTDGVTNIVEVVGAPIGRVWFRGPGAGGDATASAVLGDVLAVARGEGPTWGASAPPVEMELAPDDGAYHQWSWLVRAPELGSGDLPEWLSSRGASSAFVSVPFDLDHLRTTLRGAGVPADRALYQVLED